MLNQEKNSRSFRQHHLMHIGSQSLSELL